MKPLTLLALTGLLLLTLFAGCRRKQKFTKELWNLGDGLSYTSRDFVVDDLLANYKLQGMHYKDVRRLLGKPDDTATLKTSYQIINTLAEYNPKNKPVYKKYLDLYFNADSVVARTAIYEHTDKKGPYSMPKKSKGK
jgi:hypothetical protein